MDMQLTQPAPTSTIMLASNVETRQGLYREYTVEKGEQQRVSVLYVSAHSVV
jgi:hypothetical protein